MFREWRALFLEGLPIYEDEVVYLTFYSLNSSFNDWEQSQVLFWCCVLLVHIACAQPPHSYTGCQRLFMRGFRFRSCLNHDPREKVKDETKNYFMQIIWELNFQRRDKDVSLPDSVGREGWLYISYVYSYCVVWV